MIEGYRKFTYEEVFTDTGLRGYAAGRSLMNDGADMTWFSWAN